MPTPTRATLIVVLAVVFVLATGSYFYVKTSDPFSSLSGKLYLTLSLVGANQTRVYSYDLSKKLLAQTGPTLRSAMTASISPDGKETALSMYPQTGTATTTLQIYTRTRQTGESQQVTKSSTMWKRMPDWSPDGTKIAFMAHASSTAVSLLPNDWNVYVTTRSGKETFITAGSYPKWSPDGTKLLLLKNDGLYLYNLASTTAPEKKLLNGEASLSMPIALTTGRNILAWTNPASESLDIFSIDFASERVTLKNHLRTFGFWAVLSPDGNYVVVQEGSNAVNFRPHLTAYKIRTGEKKDLLDLQAFDTQRMFLTDWKQL